MTLTWKPNWDETKTRLTEWWHGRGLVVHLTAQRSQPREGIQPPPAAPDLKTHWTDPAYRLAAAEYDMARQDFLAQSFPFFNTQIGPGSLGIILGAEYQLHPNTVWYHPNITDPETYGAIRFAPENNPVWQMHLDLIHTALQHANGRYLVGLPDLIENIDVLAAMRGNMPLLYDLMERPGWVKERLAEINQAYYQVFDTLYELVRDEDGGNVFGPFRLWGPGKTAKLQCDFSAMISPKMFREFVIPPLEEQARWLDFSMYHLDGTTSLQQLDPLLECTSINAIEWTPQAGKPGGGSPVWYDLYRRIKAGGKAVQAVSVLIDEVIPLLDAVGPEGMYIMLDNNPYPPDQVEKLLKALEPYEKSIAR